MFYALNLFDLKDEAVYRKYLTTAGPIVQELGGDLVVMGRRTPDVPVKFPGTTIGGGQRWCIIATYKTEEDVRRFWAHPKNYDNKHLREDGTKNYIWALLRRRQYPQSLLIKSNDTLTVNLDIDRQYFR